MAAMLEHVVDVTAAVAAAVDAHPSFELLAPATSVMVVFRWVGDDPDGAGPTELDDRNTEVQRRLFGSGRAVIGRTRHDGRVALKFTIVNPDLRVEDLVALLEMIDAEARVAG
jgi:L-2,4-diaminobutyrate decarboxylase